jgi:hypothetical protein
LCDFGLARSSREGRDWQNLDLTHMSTNKIHVRSGSKRSKIDWEFGWTVVRHKKVWQDRV